MDIISSRRENTKSRIKDLREKLLESEKLLSGKACVYATGSFGRLEAYGSSDLDLFIVGLTDGAGPADSGDNKSELSNLDATLVKAELIKAARDFGIKDFDGDGKYLTHYSVAEFTQTLGRPEDDVNNTLTGRLLMFLESQPLLGEGAYEMIIKKVIDAYWRDYQDHKNDFIPAYLSNDILRLWRTFCVNYEARTERNPDSKKIKGKIKNYKLKHSRMLTCYSALLYLLAVYRSNGTVTPEDAFNMTRHTPTQRLDWLLGQKSASNAHQDIGLLIEQYKKFLEMTGIGEEKLAEVFVNKEKYNEYMLESRKFGDCMYRALSRIDEGSRYYRIIVV